jgi:putative membrane protein
MNVTIKTFPALAAALFAAVQCSQLPLKAADTQEVRGQFSGSDYKFAVTAAHGGAYEVALGNLAQKSDTDAVKQFGRRMVEDHGKAGKRLAEIAALKGAGLPDGVTAEQQIEIDHLGLLNGPDFDRAYVGAMVRAHKTDLAAFKSAAKELQDEDLRRFAADLLPVIQDHLSMAQTLDDNLKSRVSLNK